MTVFVVRSILSASSLALALAGALCSLACAASSRANTADTPEAAPATEQPEQVEVSEEAPDVAQCHTDSVVCELPEPLPPGSGCFCDGEGGEKLAGTAGG